MTQKKVAGKIKRLGVFAPDVDPSLGIFMDEDTYVRTELDQFEIEHDEFLVLCGDGDGNNWYEVVSGGISGLYEYTVLADYYVFEISLLYR